MKPTRYSDPNRLGDVMALIQVLALGRLVIRSEEELTETLQREPTSKGITWSKLADNHREFFRVRWLDKEHRKGNVALIWRHALPAERETDLQERKREPLSSESVAKLMEIAVSLHDREMTRRQRLYSLVPLGAAIIGGLFLMWAR
jgi:hypothetical protein